MRHSVFLTIKLVILMSMFLLLFTIITENMFIRFITGSLLGISLIILFSFTVKVQSIFNKEKI
ncbi:NADH dehydrogenase subunit 5 [Thermoanaerobacterium thermosaccharolyticum DSM 571]|uniref:NADH dehydrogenase subunit 5 n=1 Tax=Thermoanaerobacterium thermosaccharolyticum (strain ATCC 7956 / DSM 571 / NCIMB 9385 / NCA 3814 / NCTC 13789 / WDCM 00135 / 2032) TaxID=580327 RepID=D9TSI2_THETC|nr:NADH dehydrogenase subunit 5 [Thermoanaerobacterium thermosaccharolyticum DSM 571]KAA5805829.1 ribonuclease BN [Thermoanaerobacterium thermosaccharolyticum]